MLQEAALRVLKSGANVFLTGAAGCGKTYLLNRYIEYLRKHEVRVAVTASTGIAATHIGGMTIHSWSGLGVRDAVDAGDLRAIAEKSPVKSRVRKAHVLILDEISMLSAQTLGHVDQVLRHLRNDTAPFGGMQVIFCGDFFQLPPVDRSRQLDSRQRFAFMAPVWVEAKLQCCYLQESYRHADEELLYFLEELRTGEVSEACQDILMEKLRDAKAHPPDDEAIKLYTHNVDVDAANKRKLEELSGESKWFEAETEGNHLLVEAFKKSVLAPSCLELKLSTRVMFVKNNPDEGYMNGTLGAVVDFDEGDGWPVVETTGGKRIKAEPMDWSARDETGDVLACYTQVPLRLAWAITVHKSQGMTLERVTVDLSRTFELGQGYVALSRVKNWDGLCLTGCNERALMSDALVRKADERFQALSAQADEEYQTLDEEQLRDSFQQHILRCEGKMPKPEDAKESENAGDEETDGDGGGNGDRDGD